MRWVPVLRIAALALVAVLGLGAAQGAGPSAGPPAARSATVAAPAYDDARCGNTGRRVLLTFDDWAYGDPSRATRVGATLRRLHVRAAFFLVNRFASARRDIVRTLRRQGHWVGNHTWSHPDLTTLSDAAVADQIRRGIASNRLRPPYGATDARVARIAAAQGDRLCLWTVDTRDWATVRDRQRTVASIRALVRDAPRTAKAGGVILGHLFTHYPDAIPGVVTDLRREGLRLCRDRGPVGTRMPFPLRC
jgi:peptidoglycan/xylan/chitin deacetylase (PgdA/CDA1 family)